MLKFGKGKKANVIKITGKLRAPQTNEDMVMVHTTVHNVKKHKISKRQKNDVTENEKTETLSAGSTCVGCSLMC